MKDKATPDDFLVDGDNSDLSLRIKIPHPWTSRSTVSRACSGSWNHFRPLHSPLRATNCKFRTPYRLRYLRHSMMAKFGLEHQFPNSNLALNFTQEQHLQWVYILRWKRTWKTKFYIAVTRLDCLLPVPHYSATGGGFVPRLPCLPGHNGVQASD